MRTIRFLGDQVRRIARNEGESDQTLATWKHEGNSFLLDCGSGRTRAQLAGEDAPHVMAHTAVGHHIALQVYEAQVCYCVLWFDFV